MLNNRTKKRFINGVNINNRIQNDNRKYYLSWICGIFAPVRLKSRCYHTNNYGLVKNKVVLISFIYDITNNINMLLSGKVINNYKDLNNLSMIEKIGGDHRMIVIPKDNKQIDERGLIVTSSPIHENKSFDENRITSITKPKDVWSEIITTPVNIELNKYNITNVSTSWVNPEINIGVDEKIINEGVLLTNEHKQFILSRMELFSSQLDKKLLLVSDMNGIMSKVNKDYVELVKGGLFIPQTKLVALTLKENDTLNYNVVMRSELTDLYNKKLTERQIERIIDNYKRHFD